MHGLDDWPEVYLNASTFYPSDLEQHMHNKKGIGKFLGRQSGIYIPIVSNGN